MLLPNIHIDINDTTNPQIPLIENNIGNLLKKNYYQPETLSHDTYSLFSTNLNFNEITFKEKEKSVLSEETDYLSELYSTLEIKNYVEKNKLETTLSESINRINDYFDTPRIEFKHTIDIEEGFETFFIYIITDLSVIESYKIIRDMYKNWNLLKNKNFRRYITITHRNTDAV